MKSLIFLTLLLVIATVFSVCNAHETGVDISAWEKLNLEQALHFTKQQHAEHGAALETLKHHQKNAHIHHADAIKRIQHSKMTCSECELIIEVLQGIASSPSSINSTIAEIDALVCAKQNTTEKVKICGDLVSIVFKSILPMAFKAFTQLAWNIPQVVCAGMVKVCTVPCCADAPTVPQQLFLSFANSSNWYSSLSVTWVTQVLTPGATVRWGNAAGVSGSSPEIPTRTYSPFGGWVGQIHQAFITNLAPSTTYWYQVGSDQYGWSTNYSFTTMGTDIGSSTNPLRVLSIADVGWGPNSDDTIKSLTALLNNGGNKSFHVFQITGDVGYADFQQSAWDFFMNKFEPVFARVPTMFQIGNHESTWMNGTAYRFRLGMSQTPAGFGAASDALYFRQQIGTVHFVSLDTETAFDTADIDVPQQEWARQVLNTYPKSSSLPWTVVLHHRALYCYEHGVQCGLFADILRSQVEKIYNDKKVDLVVQGHLHTFALSWPTQNGVPTQKNYTNPTAPIYAIVGNPGNREGNDNCPNGDPKFPWLNEGYKTIGYTLLEFRSTGTQHAMKITGYESSTMQQLDQILVTKNL